MPDRLRESRSTRRLLAHVRDHIAAGRAQIDRHYVAVPLN
jgi:hypothetical protein